MPTRYLSILKAKVAELDALAQASGTVRNTLTPMLDVPAFKPTKTVLVPEVWVRRMTLALASAWAETGPVLIDASQLGDAPYTGGHPLFDTVRSAVDRGVDAVPVVRLTSSAAAISAAKIAAGLQGAGFGGAALRMTDLDFVRGSPGEAVARLLADLQLAPEQVDLVLDLRTVATNAETASLYTALQLLRQVPSATQWRSLVLAGSSIPQDLSAIERTPSHMLVRRGEWALWREIVRGGYDLPRIPTFGDYGISHPDFPEDREGVARGPVALRYTIERDYLLVKWGSMRRVHGEGYRDMARWLMASGHYAGPDFSWGDGRIRDYAEKEEPEERGTGWGNSGVWRAIGTSHHLEFVVDQVRTNNAG